MEGTSGFFGALSLGLSFEIHVSQKLYSDLRRDPRATRTWAVDTIGSTSNFYKKLKSNENPTHSLVFGGANFKFRFKEAHLARASPIGQLKVKFLPLEFQDNGMRLLRRKELPREPS